MIADTRDVDERAGGSARTGRRRLLALGGGIAGGVISLLLIRFVGGPLAWGIFLLALLALPSARSFSRRIALNLAIALGVVPLVWWTPWLFDGLGRAAVIGGVVVAVATYQLLRSPESRSAVLPRFRSTDVIVGATAIVSVVIFAPYFSAREIVGKIGTLTQATGSDNVAHFDIFEMIRRTGIASWWPAPEGSHSIYAYTTYPQQFHVLAVFGAELWAGPTRADVGTEAGLYGLGTTFALGLGSVAVVAALVSMAGLRRRLVIALPAAAAVVSLLMLGFGSTLLSYGFPNFVLAVSVTALGLLLAATPRRTTLVGLTAVASTLVVAAHSWSLLAPLVGVGLLIAVVRLPWRSYRRRRSAMIPPAVILLATVAACVYAAALVLISTRSAGSPAQALETAGAVPINPVSSTLACLLALTLLGGWLIALSRGAGESGAAGWVPGLVGVTFGLGAFFMSLALFVVQLRRLENLGYYQYKFLDGIVLIAGVLGVAVAAMLISRLTPDLPARPSRANVAFAVGAALALVLASGLPASPHPAFAAFVLPAATFENGLATAQTSDRGTVEALMSAATVMTHRPCARPVYVSSLTRDIHPDEQNEWAMALSSTWTLDSADANRQLFAARTTPTFAPKLTTVVTELLASGSDRCVIVAPRVVPALVAQLSAGQASRVFSWRTERG